MASRPWLWFGICCYVLEFFVWMAFLSQVELSVGVMLGSFNIVVIMLAGRLFFKEKLTRWRVTEKKLESHHGYETAYELYDRLLERSDYDFAPWVLLNGFLIRCRSIR